MYITEQEAKNKWCPFARPLVTIAAPNHPPPNNVTAIASANRTIDDRPSGACLASGCMAWRWLTNHQITGWCGLATRPDEGEQAKSDVIEERLDDEIQF